MRARLARLAAAVGRDAAVRELRWLADAVHNDAAQLQRAVERRIAGEPLQYIIGSQPFGALDLLVRPPVLIPRPETEDWTIRLANRLLAPGVRPARPVGNPLRLLDLCTGSACIPLLLCHLCAPGTLSALGVDISPDAIRLATDNAERTGFHCNGHDAEAHRPHRAKRNILSLMRADILQHDFPSILCNRHWVPFDLITANPPYIPLSQYNKLPVSVKHYEDKSALLGDPFPEHSDGRGLTFYRAIAHLIRGRSDAPPLLSTGGLVALEVGHNQSADVRHIMHTEACVQRTEVWNDPWGIPRIVLAWK